MKRLFKGTACAALTSIALFFAGGASAQVSSINGAFVRERVFNDDPTSVLTTVNTYPSVISFDDRSLDNNGTAAFANRHVWEFSSNGGTSAYRFNNDDFFEVFMEVTLTASPAAPRKEAGFLLDTVGGQGQFIVNTDAHEVVAFGGPLPFFAFPATFDSGETLRLGMTYFRDTDGLRKVIYHADGQSSSAQAFGNAEQGIITGSTLGGYGQFGILATDPNNFGTAEFRNISIVAVPEPSGIAVLACGTALGLLIKFRRRQVLSRQSH